MIQPHPHMDVEIKVPTSIHPKIKGIGKITQVNKDGTVAVFMFGMPLCESMVLRSLPHKSQATDKSGWWDIAPSYISTHDFEDAKGED